jgi:hypothetical protein
MHLRSGLCHLGLKYATSRIFHVFRFGFVMFDPYISPAFSGGCGGESYPQAAVRNAFAHTISSDNIAHEEELKIQRA